MYDKLCVKIIKDIGQGSFQKVRTEAEKIAEQLHVKLSSWTGRKIVPLELCRNRDGCGITF